LKTIINGNNAKAKTILYDKTLSSNAIKLYLILNNIYKSNPHKIHTSLWQTLLELMAVSGGTLSNAFNQLLFSNRIKRQRTKKCLKLILN